MESSMSPNSKHSLHMFGALPTTTNHFVTTSSVAIRLGDALRRRLLLHSSFKDQEEPHIPCSDVEITAPRLLFVSEFLPGRQSISLGDVPRWKDVFHERALQFTDESGSYSKNLGKPQSRTPRRKDLFDGRQWTNVLLAANVLIYMAQTVSDGNLLYLGAKINSLISEGQLWRLVTSSFLHANIGHLLVNCYSLNSIGPAVENICGPKRYLAIYISSAISSSALSYWFSKAPAVGASGAIFGLVGSFGMFVLRHRGMVKGTENDLKHIAQIIALNMTIGLLSQGIDNWGHAGGLIGGAAVSWLLGPAWQLQSIARDGRRVFEDKAPIFSLIRRHPK